MWMALSAMNRTVWQLQEAKSRFSELVECAIKQGAQTVTKHGKPAVVVLSAEEYQRNRAPRKSLVTALRQCPEDLTKLVGKRSKEQARRIKLG
jgi:prevent-host-death family protein